MCSKAIRDGFNNRSPIFDDLWKSMRFIGSIAFASGAGLSHAVRAVTYLKQIGPCYVPG